MNLRHDEIDARTLDRLVDGELDDVERRDVLERIERQPAEWRRLAIAFLEAQVWRSSLRTPVRVEAYCVPSPPTRQLERKMRSRARRFGRYCVVAASLAVAFGLGTRMSGTQSNSNPSSMAETDVVVAPQMAGGQGTTVRPSSPSLVQESDLVPAEVERVLREMGHRVQQRRGYVPVTLDDGRRVNVPMREVEVVPVEYRTY